MDRATNTTHVTRGYMREPTCAKESFHMADGQVYHHHTCNAELPDGAMLHKKEAFIRLHG